MNGYNYIIRLMIIWISPGSIWKLYFLLSQLTQVC